MKAIIVLAILSTASAVHLNNDLIKAIAEHILDITSQQAKTDDEPLALTIAPVISRLGIPDPVELGSNLIEIEQGSNSFGFGRIEYSFLDIIGHNSADDSLTISPAENYEILISYSIKLPTILAKAEHDIDLTIIPVNNLHLLTEGDLSFGLDEVDVKLDVQVKVFLDTRINVTDASVDLKIGNFNFFTSKASINGEPLDWDEFNAGMNSNFGLIWFFIKSRVDAAIPGLVNGLIGTCKLTDLVNGNFDCISASML